ncbi:MAG: D-glycero-beta-D-manno-heptose-7-phosphate kinase, partial [Nitrospirae bacterium]
VYDVTGAGDTVIAVFTLSHLAGASLRDAARVANHAAGVVVGRVGTATVTPEELISSFEKG